MQKNAYNYDLATCTDSGSVVGEDCEEEGGLKKFT